MGQGASLPCTCLCRKVSSFSPSHMMLPVGGLEKAMAPHSSTLAWKIPWMEEPGRLQSMGSRRVGHHWATSLLLFTDIVFCLFKSQVQQVWLIAKLHFNTGLESDSTEQLHFQFSLSTFMHWRRKWQPIPVFLPGESQGRGSLVGCHLWGHTEESDMTEAT